MQDSLEYSSDAMEIKSLFYNKDYAVYVEGEDDVIFWENIFERCDKSVHVEDLNGINEVKKYISLLKNENPDFYIAIDRDYSDFTEEDYNHKRIITTYGHSIENTVYNINTIQRVIRQLSKKTENIEEELEKEIKRFENSVTPLLAFEIASLMFKKKIEILGKNCCKFLLNNNSVNLCNNKINTFIDSIRHFFSPGEVSEAFKKIKESKKRIWYFVRGHFLSNFVINLIKSFVKSISGKKVVLPHENLFALMIDYSDKAPDFPYLKEKINKTFI